MAFTLDMNEVNELLSLTCHPRYIYACFYSSTTSKKNTCNPYIPDVGEFLLLIDAQVRCKMLLSCVDTCSKVRLFTFV